jgi:thymidylate synthase
MTHVIRERNVNEAFLSGLWWLRTAGVREESRNGPVLVAPGPVITEYENPWERVLFEPRRDCNHVFHLLEALWMLTGSTDVTPLIPFNPRIVEYTEDLDMHGAYGARWIYWGDHGFNQIEESISQLRANRNSRQVVISMWNPEWDLTTTQWKDRPCNTHLYLDCRGGKLNMTVCCRSNDMLWGAYGANVVHFSILQEFIARAVGVPMGVYRQFSNNFHLYTDVPMVAEFLNTPPTYAEDSYRTTKDLHIPLIADDEIYTDFLADCQELTWNFKEEGNVYATRFIRNIADPLKRAYLERKAGKPYTLAGIEWCDWKLAFHDWCKRRDDVKGQ